MRQCIEENLVTTSKVYDGTHQGYLMSASATGRRISFDVIDILEVRGGRISDHWGRQLCTTDAVDYQFCIMLLS